MNISVYAHITKATEVSVRLEESPTGKFAVFAAGDLSVLINSRERALEIASLLENAAQKWESQRGESRKTTKMMICGY